MENTETANALAARLQRHQETGAWLQSLGDGALAALLNTTHASGIGGRTAQLQFGGSRIFCKLVPLAPVELEAAHQLSTANLFDLPLYYQYGIGSVGFGAWRELAAQRLASHWVASGLPAPFPLLFHWRVLAQPAVAGGAADDEAYAYLRHPAAQGQDETAIRRRLDALRDSRACLALFTEYIHTPLSSWLQQQLQAGQAAADAAVQFVEAAAAQAFPFMASQGFVHFDAHLDNILTDGTRLYFADFGLALHRSFSLRADERAFLERHAGYDAARFSSSLVQNLCRALPGEDGWARKLERVDQAPGVLPAAAVAALRRHAPAAVFMAQFAQSLINVNRNQLYCGPPP